MPKESLVPFCSPPASLSAGLQHQGDSLAGQLIGESWASLWQKVLPGLMSWGILGEELKLRALPVTRGMLRALPTGVSIQSKCGLEDPTDLRFPMCKGLVPGSAHHTGTTERDIRVVGKERGRMAQQTM